MTSSVNLWGCDNLVQYVWFYMKLYYAKPYVSVVVLVREKFFIVPCVIFTYMKLECFITCKSATTLMFLQLTHLGIKERV